MQSLNWTKPAKIDSRSMETLNAMHMNGEQYSSVRMKEFKYFILDCSSGDEV